MRGNAGVTDPDLELLRDLYRRHRQGLFTLALSVTRCRARAEDAVHEAFVRLCTRRPRDVDDAPADPVAYAYRMVRHAAIDQVRRYWPGGNRTRVAADHDAGAWRQGGNGNGRDYAGASVFDLPRDGDDRFDPELRTIGHETAEFVARSLDALPPDQREAVVLRVYGGLTFAQVAAVTQEPMSTVAARYRRALDKLRPCLQKLL